MFSLLNYGKFLSKACSTTAARSIIFLLPAFLLIDMS